VLTNGLYRGSRAQFRTHRPIRRARFPKWHQGVHWGRCGPSAVTRARAGLPKCLASVQKRTVLAGVGRTRHSPVLPHRRARRTATGPPRARARWKSQRFTPCLQGGEPSHHAAAKIQISSPARHGIFLTSFSQNAPCKGTPAMRARASCPSLR
jgi:hypothetical protein